MPITRDFRTRRGSDLAMRARTLLLMLLVLPGLAIPRLSAQERITAPRADGHTTPLLVYKAKNTSAACPPLAVLSHGAGGSERGLGYLASALADGGYTAVVMGHAESGASVARADILAHGRRDGIQGLVKDPQAEQARLLDVGAALQWANTQCKAPFRVLLGHSMGAETVMLEAGAHNMIGIASPPAEQNRFDAYVAMSPQGPGSVFPDHAWSGIHKPLLLMTGTLDGALQPGGAASRQVPWRELPGDGTRHCQWMGVIGGGTHANFAGHGDGAESVEPLVTSTVLTFLKDVRAGRCSTPASQARLTLSIK